MRGRLVPVNSTTQRLITRLRLLRRLRRINTRQAGVGRCTLLQDGSSLRVADKGCLRIARQEDRWHFLLYKFRLPHRSVR